MSSRQILAWVVLTLLVLFIVFNLGRAEVWLFGIVVQMPVGMVVLVSAAMGAGITALLLRLRKRPAR